MWNLWWLVKQIICLDKWEKLKFLLVLFKLLQQNVCKIALGLSKIWAVTNENKGKPLNHLLYTQNIEAIYKWVFVPLKSEEYYHTAFLLCTNGDFQKHLDTQNNVCSSLSAYNFAAVLTSWEKQ